MKDFLDFGNITGAQGGITCEAIDEPRKSSYAIDERVIINFRDKKFGIDDPVRRFAHLMPPCME